MYLPLKVKSWHGCGEWPSAKCNLMWGGRFTRFTYGTASSLVTMIEGLHYLSHRLLRLTPIRWRQRRGDHLRWYSFHKRFIYGVLAQWTGTQAARFTIYKRTDKPMNEDMPNSYMNMAYWRKPMPKWTYQYRSFLSVWRSHVTFYIVIFLCRLKNTARVLSSYHIILWRLENWKIS